MIKFWQKKESQISRTTPGFEEDERKVPKTGLLLLIIMFIAGLFFGWRALDDVASLPNAPEPLSYCSIQYRGQTLLSNRIVSPAVSSPLYEKDYYYQYSTEGCIFSVLEKEANIPALVAKRIAPEKQNEPLRQQYNAVQNKLQETRYQIDRIRSEYGAGLQEQQAKIPKPLYPIDQSGGQIESLRATERLLLIEKNQLDLHISPLNDTIKAIDKDIEIAYKPIFEKYNRQLRWYEFKVFLLQMIFVLPFLWLVFAWYIKAHRKNSPYTLIFTAMVGVAAVLFLRAILFWFWGLFLEEVLRILSEWFAKYEIFRTLLFYGGMILSFAVFGGAVYYLQKKIFDPRRVVIRRFRTNQCPKCQSSLILSELFCPNCGYHLKEQCSVCGKSRFVDLPGCPHCGSQKELK